MEGLLGLSNCCAPVQGLLRLSTLLSRWGVGSLSLVTPWEKVRRSSLRILQDLAPSGAVGQGGQGA